VNNTEDRAAMHIALRAAENEEYKVDGVNVVPEVRRTHTPALRDGGTTECADVVFSI
jgi:hypothetical protein